MSESAARYVIEWLELAFASIPLPFLEVWGRVGYLVGFALAICAFGGFTLRPGGLWRLGRQRQAWDGQAFLSIPLTFVLIVVSGYVGSFLVLVPGAQTFESLKDLFVFLCIVLFGYPALLAVPFAYGLSDLVEGVPPEFLVDWLEGYFINPACFWVAHQLFGKDPDFRRPATWGRYLAFVLIFMTIEPVLWGYICSGKFTSEVSYSSITPALFFTTGITWAIAPFAMLGALPLARRLGLFWAEIPGHVRERALGQTDWSWESGGRAAPSGAATAGLGLTMRMFLLAPFIVLVLAMVGTTAYVTLRAAEDDAQSLAARLHQETSRNVDLQLDDYLARRQQASDSERREDVARLLASLPIARHGRAVVVDRSGRIVASSVEPGDPVVERAISGLYWTLGDPEALDSSLDFRFDYVAAKPLSSEAWLAYASAYEDRHGDHRDWILLTAMPESSYMAGIRAGHSRSAMVFALALLLSLAVAALLASNVTAPLRRISRATLALAGGDLAQRLPGSRLEELDALARSFNAMAQQLETSFEDLLKEAAVRKSRERELEASEARTRTNEERLQLAITTAGLGIWDWDVGQDRLIWDESMYRLYGVRQEDFRGAYEAWSKCLMPEDLARATGDVEAALSGERGFTSEFRVRRGDGSVRVIRATGETIRAEDGRPRRMVGINWDVTEQRAAEQELRRHRDRLGDLVRERTLALERSEARTKGILDNLVDAVVTIDGSGTILGFGAAASRIFGHTAEQAIGRNVAILMPEPDASRHDGYIRRYLETGEPRIIGTRREVVGLRKDGTEFPIDLAIAEVSIGAERLFAGVVRDISERKLAETALRAAKEAADQANRAKSAFLAHLSHEIRTPMNAALGHAQLLMRDATLADRQRQAVEVVYRSGNHLLALINDVLEMSRIEAGRASLDMTVFDLHALLGDVAAMFREMATAKGIELALHLDAGLVRAVAADPGKVRQVLVNLLGNAVKFTQAGRVDVRARSSPPAGDSAMIAIDVADTGCGIEPERIDRIFDAFEPAWAGSREGGTGLGMAVSRSFARLMRGDLRVESAVGEGSRFSFTFEAGCGVLELGPEPAPRTPAGLAAPVARRKVLVVEDSRANRDLLARLLSGVGFEVRATDNGASAIREHDAWRPDLILIDLRMPEMGGHEAIGRLRAAGSEAAIIAISASAFPEDRAGSIAAGADEFLAKPFLDAELFDKIKDVLGIDYLYEDAAPGRPAPGAAAFAPGAPPVP